MKPEEIISFYLDNEILLSPELIQGIQELNIPIATDFIVVNDAVLGIIEKKIPINIGDFEKALVLKEKHKNGRMYEKFLEYIQQNITQSKVHAINKDDTRIISEVVNQSVEQTTRKLENARISSPANTASNIAVDTTENAITATHAVNAHEDLEAFRKEFMIKNRIRILSDYTEKSHKRTVPDFVNFFAARYKELEKILHLRTELQNLISISRINGKKEKENVAFIGYVYEKAITKNENIMLTVEDPTGFIKVIVTKNKEELYTLVKDIQLDEIIGVTGTCDGLVFANNILLPDVPLTKELKKSPDEGYALVITDLQTGSKLFLEKEFNKFLSWLNGEVGSDAQKELAGKIKYIFIVGDLVEGVGVYPDQEFHLNVIDITDQYNLCAEYIKKMPKHLPIFICPGNHDVGRLSEPQPKFHDEYSKAVWTIPNVVNLSNPSLVNIYANPEKNFDGFDVMLYHGASFVYCAFNIPSIRQKGAMKRPDLIMKYLLQRRHLAPTHTSNLYIPEPKKDHLVIDKVPDFFFSGHMHRASVNNYRNVTCINASAWVSKSDEEERRGIESQPARAFVINLQTREVKVMNFLAREEQEKEAMEMGEPITD